MAESKAGDESPITIKKYANRRLYNTATSSYVTLDHLSQMVKEGKEFVVYDAKSGEDITRSVLTQIIFEEEAKGQNLLPISFLRKLISFYGDNLQTMVPRYLEMSMEMFSRNQEQMRDYMSQAFGDSTLFRQMEEAGRQNMAMFQQAMNMFAPFAGSAGNQPPAATNGTAGGSNGSGHGEPTREEAGASADDLARLRKQLQDMQHKLDRLADKDDG